MGLQTLVVGTGMMGRIVSPIIRQAGGEVVGVLGRTKGRAQELVDEYGVSQDVFLGDFDDYENALKRSDIDTVAILVPNYMHAEMGIAAANAKKHVIMEKPLATSAAEAIKFNNAAVNNGIAAEINSQYRHHELLTRLEEKIASGELGRPTYIMMNYLQDWQMDPTAPIGWRPEVAVAGKGKLVGDLGAHVLQTTLHLFGGEFIEFRGETFNVHPTRYKLKEGSVHTFGAGNVPSPFERPDLYEKMDMISEQYSGDDIARANFVLKTEKGIHVPGDYLLSQVYSGHKNDFTVDIAFENGRVSWRQEEPNRILVAAKDRLVKIIERASNPGVSGRPPGHPQGYGDAILLELVKMKEVIDSNESEKIRAYTERNIGQAVQAMEAMERWLSTPLIPYQQTEE